MFVQSVEIKRVSAMKLAQQEQVFQNFLIFKRDALPLFHVQNVVTLNFIEERLANFLTFLIF